MLRTTEQNKALHALLTELGLGLEDKERLVLQYTNGRTTRSSEMQIHECDYLLKGLRAKKGTEHERDQKRKRIISHMAEAGYQTPEGKPDMVAIHQWVKRQTKKQFNALSGYELSQLIYAADKVRKHSINTQKSLRHA